MKKRVELAAARRRHGACHDPAEPFLLCSLLPSTMSSGSAATARASFRLDLTYDDNSVDLIQSFIGDAAMYRSGALFRLAFNMSSLPGFQHIC